MHVRDDKVPCEIVDVSMLGMGVLSPRWLLDGEFVRVVFRLGAANSRERIQQADGVIVRREQGEIGCRLGIQFTVIEGQVASQIHHYVDLHGPEPSSRRRTGEYAPVEAYPHADTAKRVTTELPAAGGDEVADAATGTDGAEHDVPIDHELMSSYLESLRTVSHRKR